MKINASISFNVNHDADIIKFLQSQENNSAVIRAALRLYMSVEKRDTSDMFADISQTLHGLSNEISAMRKRLDTFGDGNIGRIDPDSHKEGSTDISDEIIQNLDNIGV